tara:strand:+ start:4012 stop:6315 length:2304 start_codon:yes stop_codon:yes gene_type:complete
MNGLKDTDERVGCMGAWTDGPRKDPIPCREADAGLFEITARDGRGRLGRLHTAHGILETPALLPVINPNIRTIEPREMWDRYGIGALITNSYIIWKHEELKEIATTKGVHSLLDYPGVIMTDSGTFQAYVYGDVEVGVEEIVEFQNSIGVDIATMLDVFSRPDMTEEQVAECVKETILRAPASLEAAGSTMLNGPIQGGLFKHLRTQSAQGMGKYDFAVHPVGGIVPVMERHLYKDYAKIMLASIPHLPPNRPVHMFGCGHPMLFPMSIALGADLFDSAAYALFARDGRLLTPWGTQKIESLVEWPERMPCVAAHTPQEVRSMSKDEKTALLARYNLEVTLSELDRCKQAIRDGTLWRLVERRSHQHPALREAFLWISTSPYNKKLDLQFLDELILDDRDAARDRDQNAGKWEHAWNWIVESQESPRRGGEPWGGDDTHVRPHINAAKNILKKRWSPRNHPGKGSQEVLVAYGSSGPWRERLSDLMVRLEYHCPGLEVMIQTPVGLLPYSMEDLNPFAHIDGPQWLWRRRPNPLSIREELEHYGMGERKIIVVDLLGDGIQSRAMTALEQAGVFDSTEEDKTHAEPVEKEQREKAKLRLQRRHVSDKMNVLLNMNSKDVELLLKDSTFVVNRLGRVKNAILANGTHVVSPRLTDGGLSVTDGGAKHIHALRKMTMPVGFEQVTEQDALMQGPAWVVVNNDAEPFVRQGRNVFHGFILGCDGWVKPGENCLIVNQKGELIGHGLAQCTAQEMKNFRKGVAVKTRGGIK